MDDGNSETHTGRDGNIIAYYFFKKFVTILILI